MLIRKIATYPGRTKRRSKPADRCFKFGDRNSTKSAAVPNRGRRTADRWMVSLLVSACTFITSVVQTSFADFSHLISLHREVCSSEQSGLHCCLCSFIDRFAFFTSRTEEIPFLISLGVADSEVLESWLAQRTVRHAVIFLG